MKFDPSFAAFAPRRLLGACTVLLGLVALPAQATGEPPFSSSSMRASGGTLAPTPDVVCNDFGPCGTSTGFANFYGASSVSNGPVITTTIDTTGWNIDTPGYNGGYLNGSMQGKLEYGFDIVGPTPMMVPLIVTGGIYSQFVGASGASGSVAVVVRDAFFHILRGDQANSVCNSFSTATCNIGFELHIDLLSGSVENPGELGRITMSSEVDFGGAYYDATRAYSTVDPFVQIDPVFLAAHPGYSLVMPEGLANQLAPVPEPASALLFAVGLAGVVLVRRRAALQ